MNLYKIKINRLYFPKYSIFLMIKDKQEIIINDKDKSNYNRFIKKQKNK